jgi:predicted tellurium resistance membrane protein TerC
MSWITDPEIWAALVTLTALEIVLGIDNIIFISIMVGRLPAHQRERARIIGLAGACGTRILLLLSLAFLARMTAPLFTVFAQEISGRDLVLIIGGLFLSGIGMKFSYILMQLSGGQLWLALIYVTFAAFMLGLSLPTTAVYLTLAIIVAPGSSVYTPQQLANVPVGVPYYNGTHYLALQMLEVYEDVLRGTRTSSAWR